MIIKNAKIVLIDKIIEKGFVVFDNGVITSIHEGDYLDNDMDTIDAQGKFLMPGFIDVHIHGSKNIDFMDATPEQMKEVADSLYSEGVTTFLATTLTSDLESLKQVARNVKIASEYVPSLGGIHLEGPFINAKYKGAQNAQFIRLPNIKELKELIDLSNNNVRYISMAPELEGSKEFIKFASENGVTVSAGHSDASFDDVAVAIQYGLTNTTHTHNAMSGHHHRKPGIVTAAMYFDELYAEMICDTIHVCPNTMKTFYKIVGPERLIMITDALRAKHSDVTNFQLFGLDCIKRDGAAYLAKEGNLAGSLLTMDQGLRNMKEITGASLIDLAKISSRNAAKSIHMYDRGEIKVGNLADFVLLDDNLKVKATYKLGKEVYHD